MTQRLGFPNNCSGDARYASLQCDNIIINWLHVREHIHMSSHKRKFKATHQSGCCSVCVIMVMTRWRRAVDGGSLCDNDASGATSDYLAPRRELWGIVFTLSVCVCVCLCVCLCFRAIFWYFMYRLFEEISLRCWSVMSLAPVSDSSSEIIICGSFNGCTFGRWVCRWTPSLVVYQPHVC